jgi:hypothetical protein
MELEYPTYCIQHPMRSATKWSLVRAAAVDVGLARD